MTAAAEPLLQAATAPSPPGVLRRLARRPGVLVPAALLTAILLACLLGPFVLGDAATRISPLERFLGPSGAHLFGTDELGRDLLARSLSGGRLSIGIAAGATLVSLVLGALWGFAAAMARGLLDELLMRTGDVLMAVPQILLALVLVAAFGASALGLVVIIGVLLTPPTARMARAAALTEIESDYYAAAVAYGASRARLMYRELLPNALAPLMVQGTLNASNAIITEAALSFLGLGIQPPQASLGTLLQQGYAQMYQSLVYPLFPALTIFVIIVLLNLLADQLGTVLDPRRAAS